MGILFVFFGGGSMFSKTRASILSLTVIAVLIFSAIGPTIVYADDDAPPDTSSAATIDSNPESDSSNAGVCHSDKNPAEKKGKKNKSGGKHSNKCNTGEETADTGSGESDASAEVIEITHCSLS